MYIIVSIAMMATLNLMSSAFNNIECYRNKLVVLYHSIVILIRHHHDISNNAVRQPELPSKLYPVTRRRGSL